MGDNFLKETIDGLFDIRNSAKTRTVWPYLFKHFNMSSYYTTSGVSNIAVRIITALVEAFNEWPKLPKYIILIPDVDILISLLPQCNEDKSGISLLMGAATFIIIKQINLLIRHRRTDLKDKKLGAAIHSSYPKVIWVRMVKRPQFNLENKNTPFSFRGKFNAMLEERLQDELQQDSKTPHLIMSVEVQQTDFDFLGGLNSDGQITFWSEINKAMQKLDDNEIKLLPRKPSTSEAKTHPKGKKNTSPRRKLPTPPLVHHLNDRALHNRRHSRSRSIDWKNKKHARTRTRSLSRSPHRSRRHSTHRHASSSRSSHHSRRVHYH